MPKIDSFPGIETIYPDLVLPDDAEFLITVNGKDFNATPDQLGTIIGNQAMTGDEIVEAINDELGSTLWQLGGGGGEGGEALTAEAVRTVLAEDADELRKVTALIWHDLQNAVPAPPDPEFFGVPYLVPVVDPEDESEVNIGWDDSTGPFATAANIRAGTAGLLLLTEAVEEARSLDDELLTTWDTTAEFDMSVAQELLVELDDSTEVTLTNGRRGIEFYLTVVNTGAFQVTWAVEDGVTKKEFGDLATEEGADAETVYVGKWLTATLVHIHRAGTIAAA